MLSKLNRGWFLTFLLLLPLHFLLKYPSIKDWLRSDQMMTNELWKWQILPLVLGVMPYPWDREDQGKQIGGRMERHLVRKYRYFWGGVKIGTGGCHLMWYTVYWLKWVQGTRYIKYIKSSFQCFKYHCSFRLVICSRQSCCLLTWCGLGAGQRNPGSVWGLHFVHATCM